MTDTSRARRIFDIIDLRGEASNISGRTAVVLNQAPTAIATLVVLLLISVVHWHHTLDNPILWVGVAIIAAATVGVFYVPTGRRGEKMQLLVPLADVVGLSLVAIAGHHSLAGLSILLGLPFFWLAWTRIHPRLVRLASFVIPLLVVYIQRVNEDAGEGFAYLLRPLLMPIMILAFTVSVSVMSAIVSGTERRLAGALREAETRTLLLNGVLNAANVGVVVVDENGHDVLMNPRQESIHRQATPRDIADPNERQLLIFGADRKTPLEADDRPVRRAVLGEEYSGQLVWIGEGDNQGAYDASAKTIADQHGRRRGSVVVFHEVTDLIEALTAKDEFLANVNHELRTPLTSIIGYLELAQDDPDLASSVGVYIGVARRNAERLLGLVGDLLDAATGQLVIDKERVDLAGIVDSCVQSQSVRAEQAGIELRSDIRGPLPTVGDDRRLGQVVDNLLSNAVKYTKSGGTITVSAFRRDDDVVLEVADTGMGMSPEELERLFTRFFRTSSVRNAAIAGAGLGLAITKELVDAHRGTIEVESAVGQGSTFRIVLGSAPALVDS